MNNLHSVYLVAVVALVTMLTRFLPFWILNGRRKTPEFVLRLSKLLPAAILGMLVVYCLKDISFLSPPYGIPELLGCAAVALLHIWKRNTLLSIGAGTVFYMLLVQWVF